MTVNKYDDLMTELAWFEDEWNPYECPMEEDFESFEEFCYANQEYMEMKFDAWDETPIAVGIPNIKMASDNLQKIIGFVGYDKTMGDLYQWICDAYEEGMHDDVEFSDEVTTSSDFDYRYELYGN